MVEEREDDWHVGAASRRPLLAFHRFHDGRRNTAPTTSDEAPSAMAARRLGKTPYLLLPSSCLLLATGLGLFCASLSPAFAQTITIDGTSGGGTGAVNHNVYGNGTQPDGDEPSPSDPTSLPNPANNNTVKINSGATVNGYYVIGGESNNPYGDTTPVTGNSVIISGGAVTGDIIGGLASNGVTVTGNSVTISGGTVTGNVIGGHTDDGSGNNPTATGNSVTITGGTVNAWIIGGRAWGLGDAAMATGNTVTISGSPDLSSSELFGGDTGGSGAGPNDDFRTGNTLNLHSSITVASAQNFENWNFYLPSTMANGGTMLTVTNTADLGTNAKVNVGIDGASSPLKVGDTVTLINAGTLAGTLANTSSKGEGMQGLTLLYGFDLSQNGNNLGATVTSVGVNPQSKAVSAVVPATLNTVNLMANTVSTSGVSQAVQAAAAPDSAPAGTKADTEKVAVGGVVGVAQSSTNARPFGSISGGHMSYDTGSSVDVNSMALIAGLSRASDLTLGRLTVGGFFEGGYGRYNADSGAAGMTVHGDGNIENIGAGVLGRLDLAQFGEGIAAGRFYTDGSLRFGRVKSDFSSSDLRDMAGIAASFDTQAWYYGLHVGGGYLMGISDTSQADFYVRYLWSHQNGDDVTLSTGEEVNFDAVNSHRTVVGGRYTWVAKSWLVPYVGAAWEHEFDGKAGSSTHGMEIATSSLVGETGMGEVGVNMGSNEGRFAFDLGAQGYVGMREGISGTFRLVYRW